jgi:hypothetical protein
MTIPPRDTTLLVLLLALSNTERLLSQSEQVFLFTNLFEVGEQLQLDPDDWEYIYKGLIYHVANHTKLNQLFQIIDTHIKAVDSQKLKNLLPTKDELLQVFELPINFEVRGHDEKQNLGGPDILQIAIIILKSPNPSIAAKESDWINRVTKILPLLES